MRLAKSLLQYFAGLGRGKIVLWCYLMWYLATVLSRFDPTPRIWLNSLGISAVIGVGLLLSVAGRSGISADRWQTFRLFLMPFCVSSFSSLTKGHGYVLVFPPRLSELLLCVGACAGFILVVVGSKTLSRQSARAI